MVGRRARGAEDRDRLADVAERLEPGAQLVLDPQDALRVGQLREDRGRLGLEQLLVGRRRVPWQVWLFGHPTSVDPADCPGGGPGRRDDARSHPGRRAADRGGRGRGVRHLPLLRARGLDAAADGGARALPDRAAVGLGHVGDARRAGRHDRRHRLDDPGGDRASPHRRPAPRPPLAAVRRARVVGERAGDEAARAGHRGGENARLHRHAPLHAGRPGPRPALLRARGLAARGRRGGRRDRSPSSSTGSTSGLASGAARRELRSAVYLEERDRLLIGRAPGPPADRPRRGCRARARSAPGRLASILRSASASSPSTTPHSRAAVFAAPGQCGDCGDSGAGVLEVGAAIRRAARSAAPPDSARSGGVLRRRARARGRRARGRSR